ncbi:receptor activity-modifying protein 2 isoform X2 [Accipiter gentilis]|uniref:receptor activity-modifying protein 2 isoform X2 n=1 Tax=Astur gentilis TaxID=8957 RepID=UPI00210F43A8|nr:receptor activity-modifying protein 2 isoform X2 [Accipiter gentilis]
MRPCLYVAPRVLSAPIAPSVLPGHYLYLDEDGSGRCSAGPLEVLGGPDRCQDTYQDWISLYCWAPFHAALMATPEGSCCCWDQISRLASCCPLHSTYSELSSCTQLLAQLLSCPWPSAILDAFFLQVHAEYFTNCTRAGPSRLGGLPPRMAVAVAVGLSCLVPLAAALTLTRAQKGAQTPAGSCPAPACLCACEGLATAPFPPSPGN